MGEHGLQRDKRRFAQDVLARNAARWVAKVTMAWEPFTYSTLTGLKAFPIFSPEITCRRDDGVVSQAMP